MLARDAAVEAAPGSLSRAPGERGFVVRMRSSAGRCVWPSHAGCSQIPAQGVPGPWKCPGMRSRQPAMGTEGLNRPNPGKSRLLSSLSKARTLPKSCSSIQNPGLLTVIRAGFPLRSDARSLTDLGMQGIHPSITQPWGGSARSPKTPRSCPGTPPSSRGSCSASAAPSSSSSISFQVGWDLGFASLYF